jgi:hypothetical protein
MATTSLTRAMEAQARAAKTQTRATTAQAEATAGATEAQTTWATRAQPRRRPVTRVNSTNVLDEGLRIGEIGRWMNSKVKLVEIGVYRK